MPSTTVHALPYPDLTYAPNVPSDFSALAVALDGKLAVYSNTAPAHSAGRMWYAPTLGKLSVSTGSAWVVIRQTPLTGTLSMTIPSSANEIVHGTGQAFGVTYTATPDIMIAVVRDTSHAGVLIDTLTTTAYKLRAFTTSGNNPAVNTAVTIDWIIPVGVYT